MRTIYLLALLLVMMGTASCSHWLRAEPVDAQAINPRPTGGEIEVTLYFPTRDGAWLETEKRNVVQTGEPLETIIIRQLLNGPTENSLGTFLPQDLQVQVDVMENIAYVSLPAEEVEAIPHQHTRIQLQALVNSLTQVEGIRTVQFLIDGKQQMSINVIAIGEPWSAAAERVAEEGYRPLRDTDPQVGEYFIEGEVLEILPEERVLIIEQHLDSGSVEAGPRIALHQDVIIHLQDDEQDREEISLGDIREGDVVGIIMTSDHEARGLIVHRWDH